MRKKPKKRKSHSHRRSDSSSTDSFDDSEVTESASEQPTSESEDEWVEKTMDDKTFHLPSDDPSNKSHSRKESTEREQSGEPVGLEVSAWTSNARKEGEEDMFTQHRSRKGLRHLEKDEKRSENDDKIAWRKDIGKGSDYEKMSKGSREKDRHERQKQKKREQNHGKRMESFEYTKDEIKRRRSREGRETITCDTASSSFSGDSFANTHFSNDEISFINSLIGKKSK